MKDGIVNVYATFPEGAEALCHPPQRCGGSLGYTSRRCEVVNPAICSFGLKRVKGVASLILVSQPALR